MYKKTFFPYLAGIAGILCFGISFTVLGSLMPVFAKELQLTEIQCSTLAGILPFGILLGALTFGPIVDRYGFRPLLTGAVICCGAGMLILSRTTGLDLIRGSIFLMGIGGGMLNGACSALISDISPDKKKAMNLSFLGLFFCLGSLAMPAILASWSKTYPYDRILLPISLLILLSAVPIALTPFPAAKVQQGSGQFKTILSMLKDPFLIVLCLTLFCQSGLESLSQSWVSTYLINEKGWTLEPAQYTLSFLVGGMALGRVALIFLLNRWKDRYVLLLYMVLSLTGAVVLYFADRQPAATIAAALIGFGLSSTFPIVLGDVGRKFKAASGSAFSIAFTVALTGATLLNLLIGRTGVAALPFLLCAAIVILLSLYTVSRKIN